MSILRAVLRYVGQATLALVMLALFFWVVSRLVQVNIYLAWIVLLFAQNASFTWVSRARNSGSDFYHAIAAVYSNGVWFGATFITFERIWTVLTSHDWALAVMIGVIYTATTVSGSVASGAFLRRFVETGKKKVGHYDKNETRILALEARIAALEPGRVP